MNKLLIFILFLMILPITFANFELEEQNLRNEKIESISNYIPISQINIKELINEKSKIKLYNADFNTVDLKDIKINNDLIYFNSKKYNINPVTFQREITKSITEYEIIKEVGKKDDLKESKKSYETYTEYKDYIAEISFECSNGNYDIYHYNELTEDKNLVKTKGNKIASLSCNNNQISLKIDSFSTYAIFESLSEEIVLDTLTNQTLNYNNVSLKGYYRLPVNETLNISFNINDENIVETELTTCETLNHGVVSGNVTIEDGAMVFDGVNGYVELSNSDSFIGSNPEEFTFIVKGRYLENKAQRFFIFNRGSSGQNAISIGTYSSGGLAFFYGNNLSVAKDTNFIAGNKINNDITLGITRNDGKYYLYYNGVLDKELEDSFSGFSSTEALIGSISSSSGFLKGDIYQFLIFSNSLTSIQHLEIHNTGKDAYSPITNGLVAQYSAKDFNGTIEEPDNIFDTCTTFQKETIYNITPETEYSIKGIANGLESNELTFNATYINISIKEQEYDYLIIKYDINSMGYNANIKTYYRAKGLSDWNLVESKDLTTETEHEVILNNLAPNLEYEIKGEYTWDTDYKEDVYIESITFDKPPISRIFYGFAIGFLLIALIFLGLNGLRRNAK